MTLTRISVPGHEDLAMRLFVMFCAAVLLSSPAWAELEVSIVDSPQWMLQHGPVIVTAKVKNSGPTPVMVPVKEGCVASNGFFFEIGRHGESLEVQCPSTVSRIGGSIWMVPGDEWLVQSDIREWLEEPGMYEAQITIQSSGKCNVVRSPTGTIPVEPVSSGAVSQVYDCWSGEVTSAKVSLQVVEPTKEDEAALSYARSLLFPKVPESCLECRLSRAHQRLVERFPSSHYTYLSGFYGEGREDLERVMDLQPDHPLAPYAHMKVALRVLGRSLTDRESPESDVSDLDLPAGLKEYIAQKQEHNRASGK